MRRRRAVVTYIRLDGLPEVRDHRALSDRALARIARVALELLRVGNEAAAVGLLERYVRQD